MTVSYLSKEIKKTRRLARLKPEVLVVLNLLPIYTFLIVKKISSIKMSKNHFDRALPSIFNY